MALFVQGCHFHCKGCFNQETWDFHGGKWWSIGAKKEFLNLVDRPYIQRVSILGGEPLCDENVPYVFGLMQEIKSKFPEKKIWLYTGYCVDDVFEDKSYYNVRLRVAAIAMADVVVDGQFQIENQDLYNEKIVFAGSTNQRVLRKKDIFEIAKAKGVTLEENQDQVS